MSANRNGRQKGMRRAYLKTYSAGLVRAPKTANPFVMREYKDHVSDPNVPEPHTRRPVRMPVKDDPSLMAAVARERIRKQAELRVIYAVRLVNTPLLVMWRCFDGYDPAASHWFVRLDPTFKTIKRSFTYGSRDSAMEAYYSKRKPIPWDVTHQLGDKPNELEAFISTFPAVPRKKRPLP